MTAEQLAFDIEGMIHSAAIEATHEWSGAPLHFTAAYYPPADLDAAFAHWQFLHKLDNSRAQSRMWHRAIAVPGGGDVGDHAFDFFSADLRCEPWKHDEPHNDCLCVGDLIYMAICEPCGWHVITGDENSAVEGWHDHAFPGWRDLPIVPARLRDIDKPGLSKAAKKWIEAHYPKSTQIIGAPIITERTSMGTLVTSRAVHRGAATTSRTPPSARLGRWSRASSVVRLTSRWHPHPHPHPHSRTRASGSVTDERVELST